MRLRACSRRVWVAAVFGVVSLSSLGASEALGPENALRASVVTTLHGHADRIHDVTFSHDGGLLASSAYDQTVRLWDVAAGRELQRFQKPTNVAYLDSLSFSPDGRLLASAHGVWDLVTYAPVCEIPSDANHVAFSPDGSLLAVDVLMQPICLLSTSTWGRVCTFESLQSLGWWADDTFGFEFSPDGAVLAAGAGRGGAARVFDTSTGQLIGSLPYTDAASGADVHDVAFTSDGTLLAIGGTESWVHIFHMPEGEIVRTLMTREGTMSLDFSPDGRLLAISAGGIVSLWDVATGRNLRDLPQTSAAMPVAFSDDGRLLACGHYDGTITLWGIRE